MLERNLCLTRDFKTHIDFFRRCKVIDSEELLAFLAGKERWLRPAVVITFDDGYANNLIAAEMLAAARLPWAVFVSTGAVGRDKAIWTVELSLLLLHGQAERIEALGQVWHLTSRPEREAAFQAIRYPLKSLPASARRQEMNHIKEQFPVGETERLLQEFPSLQMLTWEELEQLAATGVEIGSHGVNHEIHHEAQPAEVRWAELINSKTCLQDQLRKECRLFAFPNGNFLPTSPNELAAAGYALGFTTQISSVLSSNDRYLLPRLEPDTSSIKMFNRIFGK